MRLTIFVTLFAGLSLHGQSPSPTQIRFRVVPVEEAHETDSRTVVHFVTNRLVAQRKSDEPAWKTLNPDRLFLGATATPLFGWTVVEHDGSPEKANDAGLSPFSISKFEPQYRVRVTPHDEPPFLRNEIAEDGMGFFKHLWKRDVLIYVHGYNNDWPTAIKRAAQLKRDLRRHHNRDFSIVVFSWPSLGGSGLMGTLQYTDDERRYRQSLPAVAKTLQALLLKDGGTAGRGKRWALAHSMGNRVFLHGFAELGRETKTRGETLPRDLFSRVVLAAPDMEVKDFDTHTNYLFTYCRAQTPLMYFHAASNIAVQVSEFEHFNERAGVKPVLSDKLLTVDATWAKSPWSELGHGYYASNDKMVKLIADYFLGDADPSKSSDVESVDGKRWRLR